MALLQIADSLFLPTGIPVSAREIPCFGMPNSLFQITGNLPCNLQKWLVKLTEYPRETGARTAMVPVLACYRPVSGSHGTGPALAWAAGGAGGFTRMARLRANVAGGTGGG